MSVTYSGLLCPYDYLHDQSAHNMHSHSDEVSQNVSNTEFLKLREVITAESVTKPVAYNEVI